MAAAAPAPGAGRQARAQTLVLLVGGLGLLAIALRPAVVELRWESGSERDVAAFNLYRQELAPSADIARVTDDGPVAAGQAADGMGDAAGGTQAIGPTQPPAEGRGQRVNPAPIKALGNASQGARYRFRDRGVAYGGRYRYRIEELSLQGQGRLLPDAIEVAVADHRLWQGGLGILALLLGLWGWRGRT